MFVGCPYILPAGCGLNGSPEFGSYRPRGQVKLTHPPQSMHVLFPIYATSFVMITSAKPAHSESSPISPASGNELAVWGNACATSVFSAGVVTGAVVSGGVPAAGCGGFSTTAVTGPSSPVG